MSDTIGSEVSANSQTYSHYNGNVQRAKHMPRGVISATPSTKRVSGLCDQNAWDAEGLGATRAQGAFKPETSPRLVCQDPTLATQTRQRLPLRRQTLCHQMLRQRRWSPRAMRRTLSHQRLPLEGALIEAHDTGASWLTPPSERTQRIGPALTCQLPYVP